MLYTLPRVNKRHLFFFYIKFKQNCIFKHRGATERAGARVRIKETVVTIMTQFESSGQSHSNKFLLQYAAANNLNGSFFSCCKTIVERKSSRSYRS